MILAAHADDADTHGWRRPADVAFLQRAFPVQPTVHTRWYGYIYWQRLKVEGSAACGALHVAVSTGRGLYSISYACCSWCLVGRTVRPGMGRFGVDVVQ